MHPRLVRTFSGVQRPVLLPRAGGRPGGSGGQPGGATGAGGTSKRARGARLVGACGRVPAGDARGVRLPVVPHHLHAPPDQRSGRKREGHVHAAGERCAVAVVERSPAVAGRAAPPRSCTVRWRGGGRHERRPADRRARANADSCAGTAGPAVSVMHPSRGSQDIPPVSWCNIQRAGSLAARSPRSYCLARSRVEVCGAPGLFGVVPFPVARPGSLRHGADLPGARCNVTPALVGRSF